MNVCISYIYRIPNVTYIYIYVYVYIYIYICIYTHTHAHTHTYTYNSARAQLGLNTSIFACDDFMLFSDEAPEGDRDR